MKDYFYYGRKSVKQRRVREWTTCLLSGTETIKTNTRPRSEGPRLSPLTPAVTSEKAVYCEIG